MRKQYLAALAAVALLGSFAPGQTTEKDRWTVDDIVQCEQVGDFQISPDCRWVVWTKNVPDKEKGEFVSNLVRAGLRQKEEIELTRGTESCHDPKWSPDGRHLAFLTARPSPKKKPPAPAEDSKPSDGEEKEKPQLWLINPFGGEPWPLTELGRGVARYEWANADTLVFTAQEAPSLHENTTKQEKKDTSVVVEDERHAPPVRLFKVSVKTKKVTRLTDNSDRIDSFAVSPDGRHAVTIHERSLRFVYDNRIKPVVFLHDLQSGERKQIFDDPTLNIQEVHWEPDSKGFYATSAFTNHPQYIMASITELHHYDLGTDTSSKIDLGWSNGLVRWNRCHGRWLRRTAGRRRPQPGRALYP
jgi:Tol biopolymer transport system component